MELMFKLATEPGVFSNGIIYSKESLDKMINSKYTQRVIECGSLMVTVDTEIVKDAKNNYSFYNTPETCIGFVTSWEDSSVNVKLFKENCIDLDLIRILHADGRLELGMNYICRFDYLHDNLREAKGMKIFSFTLIDKSTGKPFNSKKYDSYK